MTKRLILVALLTLVALPSLVLADEVPEVVPAAPADDPAPDLSFLPEPVVFLSSTCTAECGSGTTVTCTGSSCSATHQTCEGSGGQGGCWSASQDKSCPVACGNCTASCQPGQVRPAGCTCNECCLNAGYFGGGGPGGNGNCMCLE